MAKTEGEAALEAMSESQQLAIPDDPKAASRFVAELFRTKAVYDPALTFVNPTLNEEQKREAEDMIHAARHEAGSLEEMLEGSALIAGRDFTNKPFKIADVVWRASDIEGEGLPIYTILTLALPDGTTKKLGTGARSVCEAVAIADSNSWFGVEPDKEWLIFTGVPIFKDGKDTKRIVIELHTAGDLAPFAPFAN